MALYKYFKKVPSALPNPNGPLSGRMPSEAISSANHEMLALVHRDTGQFSKTINTTWGQYAKFLHNEKPFFLHRESILIQELGFRVLDKFDTPGYGSVSAMPPVLTPTSSYSFCENTFR